jgi:DNA-binding MarR family transcriptional regulator
MQVTCLVVAWPAYHCLVSSEIDVAQIASDLRLVLGRLIRRLRVEHPFSTSLLAVLGRLEREQAQTVSALAAGERVRPQSMAQTIAELAGDGLVTRRPDPDDRRQTLIELSDLGRETLAHERARRDGWLAAAMENGLSPEEQEVLIRAVPLLARLADS